MQRRNKMPTYCHICTNNECSFEWEDEYSIKADPPTLCPKCNQETAKRLIFGGSGRGIVELTGSDLAAHIKTDGARLRRKAYGSESMYANIVGESKFQQIQTEMDRYKR